MRATSPTHERGEATYLVAEAVTFMRIVFIIVLLIELKSVTNVTDLPLDLNERDPLSLIPDQRGRVLAVTPQVVVTSAWSRRSTRPGKDRWYQEPIFVPRTGGKAEGDGWIMGHPEVANLETSGQPKRPPVVFKTNYISRSLISLILQFTSSSVQVQHPSCPQQRCRPGHGQRDDHAGHFVGPE